MRYPKQQWLSAVSIMLGIVLANTSAFAQLNRVVAEAEGIT